MSSFHLPSGIGGKYTDIMRSDDMRYTFVPSLASAEMIVVVALVPVLPIVIEILCGRYVMFIGLVVLVMRLIGIVPCIVGIFVRWDGRLLCMPIHVCVRKYTCGTDIGEDDAKELCREITAEQGEQQLFPPCKRLRWRYFFLFLNCLLCRYCILSFVFDCGKIVRYTNYSTSIVRILPCL